MHNESSAWSGNKRLWCVRQSQRWRGWELVVRIVVRLTCCCAARNWWPPPTSIRGSGKAAWCGWSCPLEAVRRLGWSGPWARNEQPPSSPDGGMVGCAAVALMREPAASSSGSCCACARVSVDVMLAGSVNVLCCCAAVMCFWCSARER
jgi:hypothetical protein